MGYSVESGAAPHPSGTRPPATQQSIARRFFASPLNLAMAPMTSWFVSERLSMVLCSSGETGSGIGALAASQLGGETTGRGAVTPAASQHPEPGGKGGDNPLQREGTSSRTAQRCCGRGSSMETPSLTGVPQITSR